MSEHRFDYRWKLADGYPAPGIVPNGCKVFGTFICGGGATMGYKLAGFNHLGGVEIDPTVAKVYAANHHPKHLFIEDLRKFNERTDLPDELYDLDILDGSPPCSTFSTAGQREKAWGKKKVFREGQQAQTLDDLVFIYCDTIAKLKPRVCLLENVSGLVRGNAKSYCKRILDRLDEVGYNMQVFLLNAATMGVPQARVRTFMVGIRKDLGVKTKLNIAVNEPPILFSEIRDRSDYNNRKLTDYMTNIWKKRQKTDLSMKDILMREKGKYSLFNHVFIHDDKVCPTITTKDGVMYLYECPRVLNHNERILASSFPSDYDFLGGASYFYTGMSVSPVQMAHIASAIWEQWLNPLKEGAGNDERSK